MSRPCLFLFLLLASQTLWAHAYLVKSAPAPRAVLHRSPARIQLWFNERLEPKFSSLSLSDADGKSVQTGKAEVSSEDSRQLSAAIDALPPGRYRIQYRVQSFHGHIAP